MNRKQRRIAQSQEKYKPVIQLRGRSYTIEEASALAIKEYSLKNLPAAAEIYRLITLKIPDHAEAYNNRGVFLYEMKHYAEALESCDKAVALNPDSAEAHNNRGLILQATQQYDAAAASYSKAIALKADYAEAYNNRGLTLQEMKHYAEALANYDKAIALKPDFAKAHNNRGSALRAMKQYNEALMSYGKAIALKADYAEPYYNQGNALRDLERYDEALASYDKAIALRPGYAEAYNNRGNSLRELECYSEAIDNYDKAVALNPGYADAYNNRGLVLQTMKHYEEALASYSKALALKPDIPYLLGNVLHAKMHLADWPGMDAVFALLARELEAGKPASTPFPLLATAASMLQQKQCAEIFIQEKFPPVVPGLWNGERYAHDKIRIGYFSADFQNHATAYLMAEFFELHDRSKFEITAFSFEASAADPMRQRLEKAFDRFIDVSKMSDLEIATLARTMEIDIAIDLKGFTHDARIGIFALRPAPVQVNYLGYPGTMGASYIDYLIADPIMIPEEHKCYYTEKIVYLPDSYQVNDSSRKISEKTFSRRECGLPETGFVFCCFNNNFKITPDIFAIWMRLLHKVEDSVLWLFEGNPTSVKNFRAEAKSRGIAENRLVFAPRMELADHLARHRLADLFLDTSPCNAHTTASDALWTGLPILTYLGETFAARVAASLLNAIGLPELITHSHAEYEALALELATHPERLATIKAILAQNKTTHPLFDTTRFTKHMEIAFTKMYEKIQAGESPGHG